MNNLLDINKFKSVQEMSSSIGEEKEGVSLCPVCDNVLSVDLARETFEISDSDKILQEINSLRRRSREIEKIITHNRQEWELQSTKIERA